MKRTQTFVSTLFATTIMLAGSGCAPMTEAEKDHLQYLNQEYANQYKAFEYDCTRKGGRLIVMASSEPNRNGIPNRTDPVYCVRASFTARFGPDYRREPVLAATSE